VRFCCLLPTSASGTVEGIEAIGYPLPPALEVLEKTARSYACLNVESRRLSLHAGCLLAISTGLIALGNC
jgi:hypothetical protein